MRISEAIERLPARAVVYISGGAGYPAALVDELLARIDRFESLTVLHELLGNPAPFLDPRYGAKVKVLGLLLSGDTRDGYRRGVLDSIPVHYSNVGAAFRGAARPGLDAALPALDAALIQVAPHRTAAGWNLGPWVGMIPDACAAARLVIAEVNAACPVVPSAMAIRADITCEAEHPLVAVAARPPRPVEAAIARRVAELVADGDTIQLGIGSLANGIAAALGGKRDLGIHTGLLNDGLADLMRAGVVTNRHKGADAGLSVTAVALGSPALYQYLAEGAPVRLEPYRYTHNAGTLAAVNRLVAVNSAIEVDLTGQVNAEWFRGGPMGGVGGQSDFSRGSRLSPGGRSIIALPSTAGPGSSRIVPRFQAGTPVTTSRADVDYIVTENGVADLRGKSLGQRADELLRVAHPELRADLARQWQTSEKG